MGEGGGGEREGAAKSHVGFSPLNIHWMRSNEYMSIWFIRSKSLNSVPVSTQIHS